VSWPRGHIEDFVRVFGSLVANLTAWEDMNDGGKERQREGIKKKEMNIRKK